MGSGVRPVDAVDHSLLEPDSLEYRAYQFDIAQRAAREHTLVSLPTGLGKTTISLLVTAERLDTLDGRSLLLAPTKPLVAQHAQFYRETLAIPDEAIVTYTGETRPDDRAELWADARVIVATPQVVENDLIGERIDLTDVVHLTIDECHRTSGNYPYGFIAQRYHEQAERPLVTGMSASPGEDREEILSVCERLGLTAIEVRTPDDEQLAPYTHETDLEWLEIELPEEIEAMRDRLRAVTESRLEELADLGVAETTAPDCSQQDLEAMRARLQERLEAGDQEAYQGLSYHAEVMKLRRALTIVETQSVEALRRYFERRLEASRSSGASKADQRFVSDPRVREAMELAREYDALHPKFRRARIEIAKTLGVEDGSRVLVFTESRDTAEQLTSFLGEHFVTDRFVGQRDRDGSEGMSQAEQTETVERFREGDIEVLVSTSVAEEGLDIPEVDLVLFFEPVPTAIRSIQRKGRTGRQSAGRVIVLLATDTRDEAYFWMSKRREERMAEELQNLAAVADELEDALRAEGDVQARAAAAERRDADQPSLASFETPAAASEPDTAPTPDGSSTDDRATIIVDQRELEADIGRELSGDDEVAIELETLAVADYVVSDRVAIERKTVEDFLDSLLGGDRDLFDQVGRLARAYERPVVIIEGEGLYERRNVEPAAIRGAVASLIADFGASVLQTRDASDTRELVRRLAIREQREGGRSASAHGEKRARTRTEQQEYVISSIAEVGPVTARTLLEAFGSVEAVITASEEALTDVEGVGEVTADRIRSVASAAYEPD